MTTTRKGTSAKYLALSDVDGTITRGSLVLDHACFLHETSVVDLGELPEKWQNEPKNEQLITALAEAYRDGIIGHRVEDFKVLDFITKYVKNPRKFYSTLSTLVALRKRNWPVHLVSGSPDFLVKPFAKQFGFTGVGSVYDTDEKGHLTGSVKKGMFGGDAKRAHVSTLPLKERARVLAFGDTMSDKPLFDAAHHSTLVDPTDETRENLSATTVIFD